MANRLRKNPTGYGFSSALPILAPRPVVANRAPTANDIVPLGTSWLDQNADAVYQIVRVDNTGAVWVSAPAAGATVVTSLQVTGAGGITVDQGDIDVTLGTVNIAAGDLNVVAGTTTVNDLVITGDFDINSANAFSIISTANVADAILLRSNGGALGQVHIDNNQGTGTDSILLESDVGGVTLTSTGLANASAIDINANAGGVTVDAALGVSIDAAGAASNFSVAGAGFDLNLESAGGRVVVNGEEAAADAIRIFSVAGGVDLDAALQVNIASSQNAADALVLSASAGGIDITAAGAAGEDIDVVNTAGSVNITAGESAVDSIVINSLNGGIDILASGAAAGEDIDIIATGSSVNIESTEAVASAIALTASNAAGGIAVESGSNGISLLANSGNVVLTSDTAGDVDVNSAAAITMDAATSFSIDGATASNVTVTGAGQDLTLSSVGGSVLVSSTENAANAVLVNANGGTNESVVVRSQQGTGIGSVELVSTAGGARVTTAALSATTGLHVAQGAATVAIQVGAGAPVHNAPQGSLYLRTDGTGINDRAYIAVDAAGTWTAIVTVA